jgi:predicted heme/steroid binding protein
MLRPQSSGTTDNKQASQTEANNDGITLAEVSKHTGRDGNSCWVVVDDTIYEISGFMQWADGVHSPSGGKARCGKDLSQVINESPHGKSKLKYLKEVGQLKR